MLKERITVEMKVNASTAQKEDCSRPPERLLLAVSVKVTVMQNVDTSRQIANGAQGVIEKIILDPCEDQNLREGKELEELKYPPACALVKLDMKIGSKIGDLEAGMVPIFPAEQSFQIIPNPKHGEVKMMMVK